MNIVNLLSFSFLSIELKNEFGIKLGLEIATRGEEITINEGMLIFEQQEIFCNVNTEFG